MPDQEQALITEIKGIMDGTERPWPETGPTAMRCACGAEPLPWVQTDLHQVLLPVTVSRGAEVESHTAGVCILGAALPAAPPAWHYAPDWKPTAAQQESVDAIQARYGHGRFAR